MEQPPNPKKTPGGFDIHPGLTLITNRWRFALFVPLWYQDRTDFEAFYSHQLFILYNIYGMKSKVYIQFTWQILQKPLFVVSYFFAPKKTRPNRSPGFLTNDQTGEALPPTQRHFPANVYPHPQASQVTPDVEKNVAFFGDEHSGSQR